MDGLWVAAAGVALVLLSILVLRLHPVIGLLISSLFVLAATPRSVMLERELSEQTIEVVDRNAQGRVVLSKSASAGQYYLFDELQSSPSPQSFELTLDASHASDPSVQSATLATGPVLWLASENLSSTLQRGSRLIAGERVAEVDKQRWIDVGERLADGFAKTFRKLGIPVTMAAIVGVCLLESGAAARIVSAILSVFGPRGTSPALTISGFILGVPVFFDNVFYLLLPLAKAVGRQHPTRYLAAVMSIIVGATMAHSLVPPTPGPLLVASAMHINIGLMMLGGFAIGGLAASVGLCYGLLCSRWWPLPVDPSDNVISAENLLPESSSSNGNPTKVLAVESTLPAVRPIPLMLAIIPIAVPITILGAAAIHDSVPHVGENLPSWQALSWCLDRIDDPGLIFIVTALLSIALLRYFASASVVQHAVARGIADAGTIVLLTCAGGAFGAALQQLDLASAIAASFAGLSTPWGLMFTAFVLTALIRGAQGSATVAMITSVAIVAPLAESLVLPFHPLYLALAIGCGSKPLPWMNDSGFWQVATMTGMSTTQTLRTFSVALTLMGLSGFAFTLLGAWLFPLM